MSLTQPLSRRGSDNIPISATAIFSLKSVNKQSAAADQALHKLNDKLEDQRRLIEALESKST